MFASLLLKKNVKILRAEMRLHRISLYTCPDNANLTSQHFNFYKQFFNDK